MTSIVLMGKINSNITSRVVGNLTVSSFLLGVPGVKWDKQEKKKVWGSFPVEIWGNQAQLLSANCEKGTNILISGTLQLDSWLDNDNLREKVKIVATSFRFLPSNPENFINSSDISLEEEEYSEDPFS